MMVFGIVPPVWIEVAMITRHKKKAIIGLGLWLAAAPLSFLIVGIGYGIVKQLVDLPGHGPWLGGLWVLLFLAMLYFGYFWGGAHLAKGKGYNTGMLLPGIFLFPQLIIVALLLFALPDKCARHSGGSRTSDRNESPIARNVRYRRNALVANSLGVAGIVVALALILIHTGLFQSQDNARVAGIFVFLAGYSAVIYGCWSWVRAKGWDDAVILIGLSPLVPLLIRYVRVLYLASGLLPLMMVLMPVLMIGVVAVLPDKSGMSQRKRWRVR